MGLSKNKKYRVCVDVDGVLAQYDGWRGVHHIGEPISGAIEFTRLLNEQGYYVIIHTTRMDIDLQRTEVPKIIISDLIFILQQWLDKHGFYYDEIFSGTGKPIALAYIDDKGINCDPQKMGEIGFANAENTLSWMKQTAENEPQ